MEEQDYLQDSDLSIQDGKRYLKIIWILYLSICIALVLTIAIEFYQTLTSEEGYLGGEVIVVLILAIILTTTSIFAISGRKIGWVLLTGTSCLLACAYCNGAYLQLTGQWPMPTIGLAIGGYFIAATSVILYAFLNLRKSRKLFSVGSNSVIVSLLISVIVFLIIGLKSA